jgi:hypothetical protein
VSVCRMLVGLFVVSVAACSFDSPPHAPFTPEQSAAGRAAYLVYCSACHQRDLGGQNEAQPLVGRNFMTSWGERTTEQLIAYVRLTMPPPPAVPNSLGSETYTNIAAFLLEANGAQPGDQLLAPTSDVVIGSVSDGTLRSELRELLADEVPSLPKPTLERASAPGTYGSVERFEPVTSDRPGTTVRCRRLIATMLTSFAWNGRGT